MNKLELAQALLDRLKDMQIKLMEHKKAELNTRKRVAKGEINYVLLDETYRNTKIQSKSEYKNTAVLLRKILLESMEEI